MKYIYILIITLSLSQTTLAQISYDAAGAEKIMTELIADGYVNGGSAAISSNGKILWQGAGGTMDAEHNTTSLNETVYRTASIAKCITAVAAMQLVEAGKLDLDLPIQTYIPDYPTSPMGTITTRHLITNTSGIAAYASGKEAQTQKEYASLTEATKVFEDRRLLFAPGSDYAYTTYGYVVLGRVIEAASGMRYRDYVQEHILDKAGMTHTGVEEYGVSQENQTTFYYKNKKGKILKDKKINNLSNRIPGGGFYSTTGDLIAFGTAVMDGTLISKETMDDMLTDEGVRKKDAGNPYAKGWYIYGINDQLGPIIGTGGEQSGCSNQIIIVPDMNIVAVIMTNTSGSLGKVRNSTIQLLFSLDVDGKE